MIILDVGKQLENFKFVKGCKIQNFFVFEVDCWGKNPTEQKEVFEKRIFFAFWPNFYLVSYVFQHSFEAG